MPSTPFHFGPALLLGLLFFGTIHLPTFLIASALPDLEPLYVILSCGWQCIHHGIFHSFLAGTLAAIVLAMIMLAIDKPVRAIASKFGLEQKTTKKSVFLAAFAGVYLHIFLDSILYSDIMPFYPLAINPFRIGTAEAYAAVYGLCAVLLVAGIVLYLFKFLKGTVRK
ncbi:MAG: metal-dependent hydrolase [Candidatus Diapherotrites archaeon]|nr:metal-dependent hydrolase [Candidatus Diapherotrites archaeon]